MFERNNVTRIRTGLGLAIGGTLLSTGCGVSPFESGCGIYDGSNDTVHVANALICSDPTFSDGIEDYTDAEAYNDKVKTGPLRDQAELAVDQYEAVGAIDFADRVEYKDAAEAIALIEDDSVKSLAVSAVADMEAANKISANEGYSNAWYASYAPANELRDNLNEQAQEFDRIIYTRLLQLED